MQAGTTQTASERSQVPTGAPREHPPPNPAPATAPPRSMRRGKKGSNKKGKVRTAAHPRGPTGETRAYDRNSIHVPARAYCCVLIWRLLSVRVALLVWPYSSWLRSGGETTLGIMGRMINWFYVATVERAGSNRFSSFTGVIFSCRVK